ncbi:MAG: hypothetical protein H0W82_09335 [Actinobacteria bacterium]|nr:hypothetical protein [Actinomycetota bacterium]
MFPVCSFCGERPVVVWFEGPDFTVVVASPEEVRSQEAWLACLPCALLVEGKNRDGLARRAARHTAPGLDPQQTVIVARRRQDDLFWKPLDSRVGLTT